MIEGYKRVVNVTSGVVNKVTDAKFNLLIASGEYQAIPDEPVKEEKTEAPKRKRRTKAEIEADKAKEGK